MYIPQNILAQEWTFLLAYNSSFWHFNSAFTSNQSHDINLKFCVLFCSHMTNSAFYFIQVLLSFTYGITGLALGR